MKFNFITSAIALCLSGLIAYGFYSFSTNENNEVLAIGSFILLGFILIILIGKQYNYYAQAINIRTVSLIFFGVFFTANILFSFIAFKIDAYIVINSITFLLYLLLIYFLIRRRI